MATKLLRDLADQVDSVALSADPMAEASAIRQWLHSGSWEQLQRELDTCLTAAKTSFTIRQIRSGDAAAVYAINVEALGDTKDDYTLDDITTYATQGSGYVAATVDNQVAGYILTVWSSDSVSPTKQVFGIASLGTSSKFQRQGIASRLLQRVLTSTKDDVYLEVRTGNTGAIALYTKLGFKVVATLSGYYKKVPGDAYYMLHKYMKP